jgi:outer membrane protein TolC
LRKVFAGVMVWAWLGAVACAQVSLYTTVDLAMRNSSSVHLAEADVRKAEAALSESKDAVIPSALFGSGVPAFPEVGFTGTTPSIWTATVQSLVFGVPQKHYIDAARFGLKAAISRLHDVREQVALDASTAYIDLDTANRELDVARQQEDFANRLVTIEQERAEAGVDPLGDLLQTRLTAAQIRLGRIRLESRVLTLATQLSALTGLPEGSITTDHASIPEIPQIHGDGPPHTSVGIETAQLQARSKLLAAKGDAEFSYMPQMNFIAQYNRNTTLLNSVNEYFAKPLPANNFSSGVMIQVPLLDLWHRAKGRESAAEALRAKVEAEEVQQKNNLQIAKLTGSIRELDVQAEISALKQQIAEEELGAIQTQLQMGARDQLNGGPQLSPKAELQAHVDERQKYEDALEAGFDLSKARLDLLRSLGHMQDWLNELHGK